MGNVRRTFSIAVVMVMEMMSLKTVEMKKVEMKKMQVKMQLMMPVINSW